MPLSGTLGHRLLSATGVRAVERMGWCSVECLAHRSAHSRHVLEAVLIRAKRVYGRLLRAAVPGCHGSPYGGVVTTGSLPSPVTVAPRGAMSRIFLKTANAPP